MENYVLADRAANEDRTIALGNNKAHIRKVGPHGFWGLSLDRGRLPDHLGGLYTSPTQAEEALTVYLKNKGRLAE